MRKWAIIGLVLCSCVNHESNDLNLGLSDTYRKEQKIGELKYAKGFSVEYEDEYTKIITHSFSDNEAFRDSVYIPYKAGALPEGVNSVPFNLDYVASQSTTHLAFLKVLDRVWSVDALCGLDYVKDREIRLELEEMEAKELCLSESIQLETLLDADPELFFNYPFGSSEQIDYEAKGIPTLLIAEYLEESQLGRLEWIKLFGLLYGDVDLANDYFDEVEKEYLALKTKPDPNKKFIMNLPFGENWHMPSSTSVGVQLMEDAGLMYFFEDKEGTENIQRSQEEMWQAGYEANYWVIIADRPPNYSMEDLLEEEAVYKEFKSVKNRQVLFCNVSTTDYFAKGVVEPNVLLKDLLFLTHQIGEHEPRYFFRLE